MWQEQDENIILHFIAGVTVEQLKKYVEQQATPESGNARAQFIAGRHSPPVIPVGLTGDPCQHSSWAVKHRLHLQMDALSGFLN